MQRWMVGIDEVGRGALAGPVTVCAALVPASMKFQWPGAPSRLRDSKKLSPAIREAWVRYARKRGDVWWVIGSVPARTVDRIGIRETANRAAARAYRRLLEQAPGARGASVVLDAGLSLGEHYKEISARSFPKADERVPAVAIASIVAKVHRDAYMRRLHKRFPGYGLAIHKGYGTAAHRAAIRRRRPSPHHRLTFIHGHATLKKSSKS